MQIADRRVVIQASNVANRRLRWVGVVLQA